MFTIPRKNVYLVLTDLHYAYKKEHRKNYFSEVMNILVQLISLADSYKNKGYHVYLIFAGDIIDGQLKKADDAMRCLDVFKYVCSVFESVYTVLGNHEENNVESNPFWFMVASLDDKSLNTIAKPLQPQALFPLLTIPDKIVDGDTTIYFNHYGVPVKIPEKQTGKTAIGIFHQNVGSNDICKMWGTFDDVEEASYVQNYDYLYFGHMHLAVGRYELNEAGTCIGEWLGTCVGTNVTEVETLPADLIVPAIKVEEGKFTSIDRRKIKRTPASEAIDYDKLELTKEIQKQKLAVKESLGHIVSGDTLFNRIKNAADQNGIGDIVDLLNTSYQQIYHSYMSGLRGVLETVEIEEEESSDG